MREGKKGLGALLFGIAGILIGLTVIIILLLFWKREDGVTVAVASRELALMLSDPDEIANTETDRFAAGEQENWYVPYMEYLYERGLLNGQITTATAKSAAGELSMEALKVMADGLGLWQSRDWREQTVTPELWTEFLTEVMTRFGAGAVKTVEVSVYGTAANINGVKAWHVVTEQGEYTFEGFSMDAWLDCEVEIWVRGREIIRVQELISREVSYENMLVKGMEEKTVTVFFAGYTREFALAESVELYPDQIIDLGLNEGKVQTVRRKRDTIDSRIIAVGDDGAELEGYGQVPFASNMRVYQTYGTVCSKSASDIIIGYDIYEVVVAEGEICAVLIKQSPDAKTIRVLLTDGSGATKKHRSAVVTSRSSFTVTVGAETLVFQAGETVVVDERGVMRQEGDGLTGSENTGQGSGTSGNGASGNGASGNSGTEDGQVESDISPAVLAAVSEGQRIVVEADCGEFTVTSLTRTFGSPTYPGTLELLYQDGGFYLINETLIEDYLCYVVPAEMPSTYHKEALKAQAICARGFAVNQISSTRYRDIGAHVDDTVNYQVYNYVASAESTSEAVRETYGEVLTLGEDIVTTYYFSTSCGYTSDIGLWGEDPEKTPYLTAKRMSDSQAELDIQNEEVFRQFIMDTTLNDYETAYGWYRWNTTATLEELTVSVNTRLANISSALKSRVLTKQRDGSWKEGASGVGKVQSIEVIERGAGGVVSIVEITGSEATVRLLLQSAVREVLGSASYNYERMDGGIITGWSNLPSAYFCLEPVYTEGVLTGYTFYGGGSGHGVGMSQNCANALGQSGVKAETMLCFFYEGTEVTKLYE